MAGARTIRHLCAILIGTVGLWVSAGNSSDMPERKLDADEAGLWMVVEKHEQEIRTSNKIINDDELASYLQRLTCRTVGEMCSEIRVYPVRAPGFNAFMAPNGAMFVQSGLLLRMRDESELATVLGHEASHFLREHTIKSVRRWHRTESGFAIVGGLISAASTVAVNTSTSSESLIRTARITETAAIMLRTAGIAASFMLVGYDKDQEREADIDGIRWLHQHGFDAGAAPRVWRRLIAEQAAGGGQSGFSLLATHPTPKVRLAYLTDESMSLRVDGSTKGGKQVHPHDDWLKPRIDLYREDFLVDELRIQHPKQFAAIVSDQIELGIAPGLGSYLKAKSWLEHAKRKRGGEHRRALESAHVEFVKGQDSGHDLPPEAYRDWGKLSLRRKDPATARAGFEKYLHLAPNAWDAKFIAKELERL